MKRFLAWLRRPDRNRPRLDVKILGYPTGFLVSFEIGAEDAFGSPYAAVQVCRLRADFGFGHHWQKCNCDRCIPF